MTTLEIKLTLPDSLAKEAANMGLLEPEVLQAILREAVRQRRINRLFEGMDKLPAANIPPMTMEEIQAEVDAVRAERKARAAGH